MELITEFLDARLQKTGKALFNRMVNSEKSSIRGISSHRNEQIRFYHWLNHQHTTKARIIKTSTAQVREQVVGRHVLAIQDTTEINYQNHANRVSGLGTVGNGSDLGLFLHPLLVVDAKTSEGLGFGAIHSWNRFKKKDKDYQKLPIEKKESYRWIDTAVAGKGSLEKASCVTFISDRESDIYEFLDTIPDERSHVLVRSRGDRRLYESGMLGQHLDSLPVIKTYALNLPKTHKRKEQVVEVHLKFSTVKIRKPDKNKSSCSSPFVELTVVQVREDSQAKDRLHWTLLTTHTVKTSEDAEQMIKWYQQRWQIEQLFRTLKSQGLDVESSQLETQAGLTKLVLIALNAALRIMQLVLARDGSSGHRTAVMFSEEEVECLKKILVTLEGRTEKQKNPYPVENLAWASWIIGRLGGWKGYKSEGPAGPIVMKRGLEKFLAMLAGFLLFRDTCTE